MIKKIIKKYRLLVLGLFLLLFSPLAATRSVSRYFFFLEPPDLYCSDKKFTLKTDLFYISISNGFQREEKSTSIIGLHGPHSLNDMLKSIHAGISSLGTPLTIPQLSTFLPTEHIIFSTPGKIRSQGIALSAQGEPFGVEGLSCGIWLPVMHLSTRSSYDSNPEEWEEGLKNYFLTLDAKTAQNELYWLDLARREIHNGLGITDNFWSKTGIGDLDCYLQYNKRFSYILRMRSLTLSLRVGILCPTGTERNQDRPSSVSFMGNGHWIFYTDYAFECELKQDFKVGALLSFAFPLKAIKKMRLSYQFESPLFSPYKVSVTERPGITTKISPYLILENLTEGLHFEARYTYLRHAEDHYDNYSGQFPELQLSPSWPQAREYHERLSSWRDHTFTFRLKYDTQSAGNNWFGAPLFSLSYDRPIGGRGVAKMNQVTLGADWRF